MSEYEKLYPKQQHTLKEVSAVFGPNANGKKAQEFQKSSPAEYAEMRKEAVAYNLVAPLPWYHKDVYVPPSKERVLSGEEERARSVFSEAEVKSFFKNDAGSKIDSPAETQKTNPAKYAAMRAAAVSYGLLPPATVKPEAKVAPVVDESFVLEPRIAREANLPTGYRCRNLEHFGEIVQNIQSAKEARVAAEKAAADREAADRANDESVSSFGRPITLSQAQALKKIEVKIG